MRRRFPALTLALVTALGLVSEARAHRLHAECSFLPKRMVRVETFFDDDSIPKSGQVEVFSADGELAVKGRLSSQGLFLFDAPEGQTLRVVVNAGDGHQDEVAIKPEQVIVAQATERAAAGAPETPPARRAQPLPIKDMLIGGGFLLALAAFVLSLRNARRLAALEGRVPRESGENLDAPPGGQRPDG